MRRQGTLALCAPPDISISYMLFILLFKSQHAIFIHSHSVIYTTTIYFTSMYRQIIPGTKINRQIIIWKWSCAPCHLKEKKMPELCMRSMNNAYESYKHKELETSSQPFCNTSGNSHCCFKSTHSVVNRLVTISLH